MVRGRGTRHFHRRRAFRFYTYAYTTELRLHYLGFFRCAVLLSCTPHFHFQQPGPADQPARLPTHQPIELEVSRHVPSTGEVGVSVYERRGLFSALLFLFFLHSGLLRHVDAGRFVGPFVVFVWALGSRGVRMRRRQGRAAVGNLLFSFHCVLSVSDVWVGV
jgi:hypothetical protein